MGGLGLGALGSTEVSVRGLFQPMKMSKRVSFSVSLVYATPGMFV